MTGARFLSKNILEDAAAIKSATHETASDGRRQTSLEKKITSGQLQLKLTRP